MTRRSLKLSEELRLISMDDEPELYKSKERETLDAAVVELSELFRKQEEQDARIDQISSLLKT